jgi:hypothetical protein
MDPSEGKQIGAAAAGATVGEGRVMDRDTLEAQYLDAGRFPLTSQPGLTFRQQKLIDAVNADDCRRLVEEGKTLTDEQRRIRVELEAKRRLLDEAGHGRRDG